MPSQAMYNNVHRFTVDQPIDIQTMWSPRWEQPSDQNVKRKCPRIEISRSAAFVVVKWLRMAMTGGQKNGGCNMYPIKNLIDDGDDV